MVKYPQLNQKQIEVIKAMHLRRRPAPACGGFVFLNSQLAIKLTEVYELVKRGLLYRLDVLDDDKYDLTDRKSVV